MYALDATHVAVGVVDMFEDLTANLHPDDAETYVNVVVSWTNSHGRMLSISMSTAGPDDETEADIDDDDVAPRTLTALDGHAEEMA